MAPLLARSGGERDTLGRMSSEAIDLVRRGYDAYRCEGIEGIIPILDPAVEWRNPPDSPIAGVFHGHDGVREWQRLADESFDQMDFWPRELIEAPDGRILAICDARVRGRGSDVVVEVPFAHVVSVRGEKAVAFEMYSQVADARATVGVSD
jgi:ketosteroid isomerase-like protein